MDQLADAFGHQSTVFTVGNPVPRTLRRQDLHPLFTAADQVITMLGM